MINLLNDAHGGMLPFMAKVPHVRFSWASRVYVNSPIANK